MKKVIVISGGSEGLGYEIAKTLIKKHWVIILSADKLKLEKSAKKLKSDYLTCDVSNEAQVSKAIEEIIKKYKRIDCLINNAGIWIEGELVANDPAQIKRVLEVNALGTMLLTHEVLSAMKKQRFGLIINIISQAGLYGKAERSVYAASKFAITGFTKSLQMEVSKYGVRVTGIYPNKMRTKLFEKVGIKKDLSDALEPAEVAKAVEFVVSAKDNVLFTEIGLGDIKNY